MNSRSLIIVLIAVLAAISGIYARYWWADAALRPDAEIVDFQLPDSNGNLHALSEWRGKTLVVNFWASWCGPCLREIPEFIQMQQDLQDKGVQFIGVAVEDKQPVLDYLQRVSVNYPVLIAGDAGMSLAYKLGNIINAVPYTVVVNAGGHIAHRQPGELSRAKLLSVIEPVMAQNP